MDQVHQCHRHIATTCLYFLPLYAAAIAGAASLLFSRLVLTPKCDLTVRAQQKRTSASAVGQHL
jgi:hypothetical protein